MVWTLDPLGYATGFGHVFRRKQPVWEFAEVDTREKEGNLSRERDYSLNHRIETRIIAIYGQSLCIYIYMHV